MSRAQLTSTVEQNTGGAVAPFVAGKNKIINGDFGIWQRGTSFSGTGQLVYTADRWLLNDFTGVTSNVSRQAFTAGAAPVSGYESAYYAQWTRASSPSSNSYFQQKIEDVRTFAGQTVTISFWAQSGSGTPTMNVYIDQNFGTGGSSTVNGSAVSFTLSTSWQRYTATIALSSISGKTIGTGSSVNLNFSVAQAQGAFTINLWGVQAEVGSVATPFTTASNTFQGELSLCQRYYYRSSVQRFGIGYATSSGNVNILVPCPVSMRVPPTSIDQTNLGLYDGVNTLSISSVGFGYANLNLQEIACGTSSAVTLRPYILYGSSAYLGFSAEL